MIARKSHTKEGGVKRQDVARLAGVSPSTVSLVLNNHPAVRVAARTRERIYRAVRTLGYAPNAAARMLVTGKRDIIGVVLYFEQSPFNGYSSMLLKGIWPTIRGKRMLIGSGEGNRGAAGFFLEKLVDGLIIVAPCMKPNEELRLLTAAGFPCTLIGSKIPNFRLDYVDIDNYETARLATNYLLKAGHRRIVHITGPIDEMSSARERLAGYKAALEEGGIQIDPALILFGNYLSASGELAIQKALQNGLKFTAIFAANDSMAFGAWRALREHGMRVPEDISLIGLDGVRTEDFPYSLTTYRQPLEKIGQEAAKLLLERLQGEQEWKACERLFPCEFIKGATVAAIQEK